MKVRFLQKVITYFGTFDKDETIIVTTEQADIIRNSLGDAVEISASTEYDHQLPTFNQNLISPAPEYTKLPNPYGGI